MARKPKTPTQQALSDAKRTGKKVVRDVRKLGTQGIDATRRAVTENAPGVRNAVVDKSKGAYDATKAFVERMAPKVQTGVQSGFNATKNFVTRQAPKVSAGVDSLRSTAGAVYDKAGREARRAAGNATKLRTPRPPIKTASVLEAEAADRARSASSGGKPPGNTPPGNTPPAADGGDRRNNWQRMKDRFKSPFTRTPGGTPPATNTPATQVPKGPGRFSGLKSAAKTSVGGLIAGATVEPGITESIVNPEGTQQRGVGLYDEPQTGVRGAADFATRQATGVLRNIGDGAIETGKNALKFIQGIPGLIEGNRINAEFDPNAEATPSRGPRSLVSGGPVDTSRVGQYGDPTKIMPEPGTGSITRRSNPTERFGVSIPGRRGDIIPIDARGRPQEPAAPAQQPVSVRDAKPERYSGNGIFSGMANAGLDIRDAKIARADAAAGAAAMQQDFENRLAISKEITSRMGADTDARAQNTAETTAAQAEFAKLSDPDPAIRALASRNLLGRLAEDPGSEFGRQGLAFLISEIDKASEVGFFDDFMESFGGQDQSIPNDRESLFRGLEVNDAGNVTYNKRFIADFSDIGDESVKAFLLNDLPVMRQRKISVRDTRGEI